MVKTSVNTIISARSNVFILALLTAIGLAGCDSGANDANDGNAYISVSLGVAAANRGASNITPQSVGSIIITATDKDGHSTSGEIKNSGGSLTLNVRPYTPLTLTGVAYEGGAATYRGQLEVPALRPGQVYNAAFNLDPINPAAPFADPSLEACIDNVILTNELQSYADITNLSCSCESPRITDVSGIEKLTNLQTLFLSDNKITDIGPLSGLTKLTELYLGGGECDVNNVTDLSPLSGLSALTVLDLSSNSDLSNVAPLAGLTNLQSLSLADDNIDDISSLGGLSNVQILNVSNNRIKEIGALNTMVSLTDADLYNNIISDVSLVGLPNLQYLDLSDNMITSFAITESMPQLTSLYLGYNHITDFSVASGGFPNLKTLSLTDNNIRNIDDLATMTSLNHLYLANNNVEDITALSDLTSLTYLYLYNNNVNQGVASLGALSNANPIDLRSNPGLPCDDANALDAALDASDGGSAGKVRWDVCFSDVAITELNFSDFLLQSCVGDSGAINVSDLISLSCPSFGIADLTGIEQLVKLQALDLSGNTSISNFSGLSSLRDLTSLNLSNAGVNDLSELSLLKNLADLKLDTNAFTSLEDMYGYNNISGLTNLTSVSLISNHISTGLLGLATLYKAQSIDLTCSQAALENDIIALDQALDSGDGAGSGVVRWTICP